MSTEGPVGPPTSEAAAPFWDATRERRLVLQRCDACDRFVWYPRARCPGCLADDLTWTEVSGRGTVYASSVHHRPAAPEFADLVPYVVALIELDEGVRLLTNIVGAAPADVDVGQRVRATWAPLADGRHLLQFEHDPGDERSAS